MFLSGGRACQAEARGLAVENEGWAVAFYC